MNRRKLFFLTVSLFTLTACSQNQEKAVTRSQNIESSLSQPSESLAYDSKVTTNTLSDWKVYENEKHGFKFNYPHDWEAGSESCLPYQADCDGGTYDTGVYSQEDLGVLTNGVQVAVLPTTDRQAAGDFVKNKMFDGKWFSFQKEDSEKQIYSFSATTHFDFPVRFIAGKGKTYVISPALQTHDAILDKATYDQVISSFEISE